MTVKPQYNEKRDRTCGTQITGRNLKRPISRSEKIMKDEKRAGSISIF